MMAWALHPAVVMRPEPRALLLFQRQTAELLELDAQGLDALRRLLTGHPLRHWRAWVGGASLSQAYFGLAFSG
jgi:hypothetical protein